MHLFLLAHQDDELFVLARLLDALRQGDDVAVIFVTDGGAESARRDRESRAVLLGLGVKPHRIVSLGSTLGLPDGKLYDHLDRAFAGLGGALDALPVPQKIFTHAWEGGHQDHDCVHALAVLTAQSRGWAGSLYQVPFYRAIEGLRFGFASGTPLPGNGPVEWATRPWPDVLRTLGLMFRYRSQWRTFVTHGPAVLMRRLVCGFDALQRPRLGRLHGRPHEGLLYYERKLWAKWETVSAKILVLMEYVSTESRKSGRDFQPGRDDL